MASQRVRHDWATSLSLFHLQPSISPSEPWRGWIRTVALKRGSLDISRDTFGCRQWWKGRCGHVDAKQPTAWPNKQNYTWLDLGMCHWTHGLPRWLSGRESTCQCRRCEFDPWVGKIPWRRNWQTAPVFLPRKFYEQEKLGYSSWGCRELNMIEWLSMKEETEQALSWK